MKQRIIHIALVVKHYDEAVEFFTAKLGFDLIEDTYQPAQGKRWVVVAPPGGTVAVFEDLYGNMWDLIQLKPQHALFDGL